MREDDLQDMLWEIVRAVATEESTYYNDSDASIHCPYCLHHQPLFLGLKSKAPFPHDDQCIVTKARKLVEKGILANL